MKNRFQIKWTKIAAIDLSEIVEFIAIENPKTAKVISKKIKGEVSQLKLLPFRGRIVPEFEAQGFLIFRELIIPPWRAIYRVSENRVLVLGVIDSRMNIEDVLLNRIFRERQIE